MAQCQFCGRGGRGEKRHVKEWDSRINEHLIFTKDAGNHIHIHGPIDNKARKSFMLKLTLEHNIYSVGRFACWKNILLDDVYDDSFTIRAMINSDPYDKFKGARK